jgi:hypothetical protein
MNTDVILYQLGNKKMWPMNRWRSQKHNPTLLTQLTNNTAVVVRKGLFFSLPVYNKEKKKTYNSFKLTFR